MIARLPGWQRNNNSGLQSYFAAFSFMRIAFLFFFFFIIFSSPSFANNLAAANSELVDQNSTADTVEVEFDLSWGNSWKDATNNDAVWVFMKYCTANCSTTNGTAVWSHATLKTSGTNPAGVSRGSGTLLDVIVTLDKKGAFIQRTGQGTGTVTTTDIQLQWDYGNDGVSDSTVYASTTKVRVFAIEMVYVPDGPFYLGDIADGTAVGTAFNFEYGGAATSLPGLIAGSEAISFNTTAGTFYYNNGGASDSADGAIFTLPDNYPVGYYARYVMKYELTEDQWVAFINTLLLAQQTTRDITSNVTGGKNADTVVSRNTISWASGGAATTTRGDRSMGYLGWYDLAAYLDWAALRPMSEIEFEKFARGPLYPVAAEYAWGTTGITTCAAGALVGGAESGTTTCSTANANAQYAAVAFTTGDGGTLSGPVRAGMFSTASSTTRLLSGASYWGILDLTGNMNEMMVGVGCISGGNFTSRQFAATNGDGVLTSLTSFEGNATNVDWPGLSTTSSQGITTSTGVSMRGGNWNLAVTAPAQLQVANREDACIAPARTNANGGRGVRTENS